jgi:hypothetical protein
MEQWVKNTIIDITFYRNIKSVHLGVAVLAGELQ